MIGDNRRLKQILVNLLDNALLMTSPANGTIEIGVSFDIQQKLFKVQVNDEGYGVPINVRSKLYEAVNNDS